jgi:uncharacterized protein YaaN involved in tellurite resistance
MTASQTMSPAVIAEAALRTVDVETAEDRRRIDRIRQGLDPASTTSVLTFGSGVERDMAGFADAVLDQVLARDTGAVHDRLDEIKAAAAEIGLDRLNEDAGFFGRLFAGPRRSLERVTETFQAARLRIDTIAAQLDDQIQAIGYGLAVLDRLFEQNLARFRDLTLHVRAAREVLEEMRSEASRAATLPLPAGETDALLDAQRRRDREAAIDRLERKVLDLEKSRLVALSMLPAIRRTQDTGASLLEALRTTVAHAVPAWKSAMIVHLEQLRQRHGLAALGALRDAGARQLADTARRIGEHETAVAAARDKETGEVAAMVSTMNDLMATLDTVDRLEREAAAARQSSRDALGRAEGELRQRLAGTGGPQ